MDLKKIQFVFMLICLVGRIFASVPTDSLLNVKNDIPAVHSLMANVPSGDPTVMTEGCIPKWVVSHVSPSQLRLVKKYLNGKKCVDFSSLLPCLMDSLLTSQYFECFQRYITDSAINERDEAFKSLIKDLPASSCSTGLPQLRFNYPIASFVEDCQLCRYHIYSPVNGDDIHVVLDVVFKKKQNGTYVIEGQYLRLTGKLSENAVLANEKWNPVDLDPWHEKDYDMFPGCISAYLYYFKDGKPKQVLVNSFISISPKL